MSSLEKLTAMNDLAAAAQPVETNPHCSFHKDGFGITLHSAKKRATVILPLGRKANDFLILHRVASTQAKRDALIESYFP
jgi:hypothetical protein